MKMVDLTKKSLLESKWWWWSFIPWLNFAAWVHAGFLTKNYNFFWYAGIYGVPFVLACIFMDSGLKDMSGLDNILTGLAIISWIVGIIHVRSEKKRIKGEMEEHAHSCLGSTELPIDLKLNEDIKNLVEKFNKELLETKSISANAKENEPSENLANSQQNAKTISEEVITKLEKIITDNCDGFREEENFKVRPGYGPDKFYLNQVEGSYEDSLQLLIHYILYEEGLYKKFLTKNQMADCETVISDDPDSIYGSDDEDIQEKLDNIYGDSIGFVGKKLLSLGFDVGDDFEEYLSD
jgi:hypothetical protein